MAWRRQSLALLRLGFRTPTPTRAASAAWAGAASRDQQPETLRDTTTACCCSRECKLRGRRTCMRNEQGLASGHVQQHWPSKGREKIRTYYLWMNPRARCCDERPGWLFLPVSARLGVDRVVGWPAGQVIWSWVTPSQGGCCHRTPGLPRYRRLRREGPDRKTRRCWQPAPSPRRSRFPGQVSMARWRETGSLYSKTAELLL